MSSGYKGVCIVLPTRCRFTGTGASGVRRLCRGGWFCGPEVALAGADSPSGCQLGRIDRVQGLGLSVDALGKQAPAIGRAGRLSRRFHRALYISTCISTRIDARNAVNAGYNCHRGQPGALCRAGLSADAPLTPRCAAVFKGTWPAGSDHWPNRAAACEPGSRCRVRLLPCCHYGLPSC